MLDRKRRRTGPDPDHASVPDQGQLDRLRGAVAHAHLGPHGEGRAGRRGERVARDPRPVAGDDREAVEHGRGPPLGPPDGVDASAPEGGDERRLALGRDEEDRLRGPDPLALPLPVEARLAQHPRGPAPLPPRVLSEEVVPPVAELRKASHVLVGAAEARVAERSQQVVAVRVGRAPDPEPEHPFLAVVEGVGERPHGGAALPLDDVDQLLEGRRPELLVRREGVGREREPAHERPDRDRAEQAAAEPVPARLHDDHAIGEPAARRPAPEEAEAGDEEEHG